MAKALKDIHDAAERDRAVIDLQREILAAQEQQFELIRRVHELEQKVARSDAWDAEKKRYQLKDCGGKTFAYELKASEANSEPIHLACANCYQRGQIAILQFEHHSYDNNQDWYECPSCKNRRGYARCDQALSRHLPRKITSWISFLCANNCGVRSMDWFEKITGFCETSYEDTRTKLQVDGSQLQSLANGKSYRIGELELVSLQALRERVKSADALPGRLKVSVVSGDVRQMHQLPENAGALFQVASQFNLLEMVSPTVNPEQGVTRYQHDRTQGPACAIAAGAATIYRNYFALVDGSDGQTATRQLDGFGCFIGSSNLRDQLTSVYPRPRSALSAGSS